MTITNHILAGSIIGLAVSNPVLAIVLALASHFVTDALPHFGYAGKKGYSEVLKHKLSYVVVIATLITTIAVLLFLALHGKWFAIFIGLVAASPDAVGLYTGSVTKNTAKKPKDGLSLYMLSSIERFSGVSGLGVQSSN